jgi:hypothetical protein
MTRLPGYDNWKLASPPYYDPEPIDEDEGLNVIFDAIRYLGDRADADEEEQLSGEFEATEILRQARERIMLDYQCRFCGKSLPAKNGYCSRPCARADAEGL